MKELPKENQQLKQQQFEGMYQKAKAPKQQHTKNSIQNKRPQQKNNN